VICLITSEKEYKNSLLMMERFTENEKEQIELLKEKGLSQEQIKFVLSPSRHYYKKIKHEIEQFEKHQKGDFSHFQQIRFVGKLLVALRIYRGYSQKELADRLGVKPSQVSLDEKNEYMNVTHKKLLQTLHALGFDLELKVKEAVQESVNGNEINGMRKEKNEEIGPEEMMKVQAELVAGEDEMAAARKIV
jgi:transcriptional regulator with XRE-family HTH domain